MYLPEELARKIINLNPYPRKEIIDQAVADRQFQVIWKGFNYLIQPENQFLYIGDEVGLGKTYIAMGIASLLRLYSNNPQNHTDVILVPKRNLQYKWQKEIRNFISNNYLQDDNVVKSILKQPVAQLNDESIKASLCVVSNSFPGYHIYRNSSFSIPSVSDSKYFKLWLKNLEEKLPDDNKALFRNIAKKYRNQHYLIKRAFAYLLNHAYPEIDLMIVDEAHNYRHGVGNDVSLRNQIVSRVFGAVDEDEELFTSFPELKQLLKPKIKKLLLLSATPINHSLLEIKNQLDCFLPTHQFSNIENNEDGERTINESLNKFLIRGVMSLKINHQEYSRNGYRHEHRKGNVEMKENADCQIIKDDGIAMVLSLMQYKTIKELKLKNGNQFEMGMLAGFESFHQSISEYENDSLENKKEKEAKDESVLKEIIDSYFNTFNNYPPHPKQESLIDELLELMADRKKALVFVRRIASVREIERQLFKRYSDYLIDKIKKSNHRHSIPAINMLLQHYQDEVLREGIESTLDLLGNRIYIDLKSIYQPINGEDAIEIIPGDLREIYYSLVDDEMIFEFKELLKSNVNKKYIKSELKESAINLLKRKWEGLLRLREEDDDDQNTIDDDRFDEEKAPYFFQRFFTNEGKPFKNKSYRKDWYELNLYLINKTHNLFATNELLLTDIQHIINEKTDASKMQKANDLFVRCIGNEHKTSSSTHEFYFTNTFITELLINLCQKEFNAWIEYYKPLISSSESRFINELNTLAELVKSIFRQGSGLIPSFIADAKSSGKMSSNDDFIEEMRHLLTGEFTFVLEEIKQIIIDYEKLIERNFDNKDRLRYNLVQQLPVAGVSGQHKRDVRKTAIQFRMPGYPYVLITTDILKEGEDLHSYCKNIYHYGIAWNPSDMEQRTGRIDRIDSLSYRALKKVEEQKLEFIPFENKLQVFYPYLTDTLEVNQMIKLFNGMDKFIDIFYNDLSVKMNQNSKAEISEVVINIPEQRKGLLKSKYDHDSFVNEHNGVSFEMKHNSSITFADLKVLMEKLMTQINQYSYIGKPIFDESILTLSGILNVNDGRNGPFTIFFKQNNQPGHFVYKMESLLGKVHVLGRYSNKEKVLNQIENYNKTEHLNLKLRESNTNVYLTLEVEIENDSASVAALLYKLVYFTDEIENSILNTDEIDE